MSSSVKTERIEQLALDGLRLAPPQVLGGIRLVPLVRDQVRDDLRLSQRLFDEEPDGALLKKDVAYYSYVPHALVATWSNDGSAVFGTQLSRPDGSRRRPDLQTARMMRRMARREEKNCLRFLPLHLAMEGFLTYQFGGPTVAWSEYSREANSSGLSPRGETSIPGRWIAGLVDALRVFEIHEGQVGTLVFVADALASAFIVPHPADYLALHETLLTDFYGELLFHYSFYATENAFHPQEINEQDVSTTNDLRLQLRLLRQRWAALHAPMVHGLFENPIQSELVYRLGPFTMQRFMTELDPKVENHIGEMIRDNDGQLQYLKSYRLSAAQCRRAYLLKCLSENDWELAACANQLNCNQHELVLRMENAGFGYLLHSHVIDAARAWKRR